MDATNFEKCVLKNADFRRANFRPIEVYSPEGKKTGQLWSPSLASAIMTDSDMSDACLKQVNLKGTDFGGVNVTGTKFVGCDMDDGVAEKLKEQGATVEPLPAPAT